MHDDDDDDDESEEEKRHSERRERVHASEAQVEQKAAKLMNPHPILLSISLFI